MACRDVNSLMGGDKKKSICHIKGKNTHEKGSQKEVGELVRIEIERKMELEIEVVGRWESE